MIEIKNTEVHGLERSIIDSGIPMRIGEPNGNFGSYDYKDIKRACDLGSVDKSTGHDNFLKGIDVYFHIKYPQYWTMQAQRYHWFDIISSQSKMHMLIKAGNSKEFSDMCNKYVTYETLQEIKRLVEQYNANPCYENYMYVLSNCPLGFEMWMSCKTSYLQLKNMYTQRKNHKLREDWGAFCNWAESLPMFKELVLKDV